MRAFEGNLLLGGRIPLPATRRTKRAKGGPVPLALSQKEEKRNRCLHGPCYPVDGWNYPSVVPWPKVSRPPWAMLLSTTIIAQDAWLCWMEPRRLPYAQWAPFKLWLRASAPNMDLDPIDSYGIMRACNTEGRTM